MAGFCLWLACADRDNRRFEFITGHLEQRAQHLEPVDRHEIARGLLCAEQQTGVDAFLLLAVVEEESRFRPRARSRRGALGLLQIRPGTGRDVAHRHRISWEGEASLLEPSVNLLIGATYLSELREGFGSWDLALTAYHQGPTRARSVARPGRNPSSQYAARVLERFESVRRAAGATTDQS